MIAPIALDILRAVAVLMLARIAASDFMTQKIRNEHVLQLLAVGGGVLLITFITGGDAMSTGLTLAMSAGLFLVLLVFWLLGKVGAGDVKLLTTIPILVGYAGSLPFVAALLVFTLLTYFVMKFPILLPERWFRTYVAALASTGRVPFGVPIAGAAIVVLLLPANMLGTAPAPRLSQSIQQACSSAPGDQLPAAVRNGFC